MRSFLAALLLALPASGQVLPGAPPPEITWEQRLGNQLPLETRFTDQDGRSVTLDECIGERPVVLALVYYECPMLCGLVLEGLVKSLRAVDFTTGQDFDVLVASIDPSETTSLAAAKRRSALSAFGLDVGDPRAASWRFLTGEEPAVRALAEAVGFGYRYVPETDEWAHAAGITIVTPQATVSRILFGVEYAPRDVRLARVEGSQGKIGTFTDQVLLRCFHYDPTRGKYGLAILRIVRFFGTLTLVLLAFFVVRWLRREPRAPALSLGGG